MKVCTFYLTLNAKKNVYIRWQCRVNRMLVNTAEKIMVNVKKVLKFMSISITPAICISTYFKCKHVMLLPSDIKSKILKPHGWPSRNFDFIILNPVSWKLVWMGEIHFSTRENISSKNCIIYNASTFLMFCVLIVTNNLDISVHSKSTDSSRT